MPKCLEATRRQAYDLAQHAVTDAQMAFDAAQASADASAEIIASAQMAYDTAQAAAADAQTVFDAANDSASDLTSTAASEAEMRRSDAQMAFDTAQVCSH